MLIRHVINKSPTFTYDTRKCGMEWLGAAISASGSTVNTGLSNWMNRGDAHMAWRRNQGMQEDAQEFASEEAQKQRDWEAEEWQRQWEIMSAYNSPAALRARYELAGINPYMAMGDGMSGQVVSSPSTPVGASGSAGVGSAPLGRGSSIDIATGMAEFSKALENLTSARKNTAEYDSIRKKLDSEIESIQLDNESKRAANAVANDLATWVMENRHAMPAMTYRELTAKVANIAQSTAVAESEEALNNVQKEIAELQKKITKYDSDLADRMTTKLDDIVKLRIQRMAEENRTIHNQGTMYAQQGSAAMSQAETSRKVGDSIVTLNNALARLHDSQKTGQDISNARDSATFWSDIELAFKNLEQAGIVNDKLRVELEIARKNRDWQTAEKILHSASTVASTLRDLGIGFNQISSGVGTWFGLGNSGRGNQIGF